MRAQLRTYHAIPSLQARQDPNSYKQLQDAPRLKSILKGASEDQQEPTTIERIKVQSHPRTNPVNLIFVLCQYAPKMTEIHFDESVDFYDLVMRNTITSKSRSRAFLWLMWWYLESDFSEKAAEDSPFGPGLESRVGGVKQRVPEFEYMTEEQAAMENVDTEEEIEYGMAKQQKRKRIIESDLAAAAPSSKRGKKGEYIHTMINSRLRTNALKPWQYPMKGLLARPVTAY